SGKGMAIDSQGNAWITNTLGTGLDLAMKLRLLELKLTGQMSQLHRVLFDYLNENQALGSISMLRPDGAPAPGSPFDGGGTWGSWAVAIDGNDTSGAQTSWAHRSPSFAAPGQTPAHRA